MLGSESDLNKWQLICPVGAMGLVALVAGVLAIRSFNSSHKDLYFPRASIVGEDLVTKTNSEFLTSVTPELKSNLVALFSSPARLESLRHGELNPDEPSTDDALLSLANEAGGRLQLTLRWQPKLRKFVPVSFTNGPPPQIAAPPLDR